MKHPRTHQDTAALPHAPGRGVRRHNTNMTMTIGCGFRGMQEQASLLGGRFHLAGTSGVGTAAIASVPAAEGFVP